MPGSVSDSYKGPGPESPYVPSWCYANNNPPMCGCGHHHGYHSDDGACLLRRKCLCPGYDGADPDAPADSAAEQGEAK